MASFMRRKDTAILLLEESTFGQPVKKLSPSGELPNEVRLRGFYL